MVLLAAAICTKGGKALVSRQFVEMTRARIEGLLASFPKLIGSGKQHTFIETESVRYVYQPLEKLYMLLITTKASNILEDLETLRLFSRVIPEYCKAIDEKEIHEHSFELLFAFDEIVALGYRENVNLAQIRTFTDMDSHEEKVFKAMRETQEREAKERMLEKSKEITRLRNLESKKLSSRTSENFSGGFGSSSNSSSRGSMGGNGVGNAGIIPSSFEPSIKSEQTPSYTSTSGKPNRAMKLVNKDALPAFVEQAKPLVNRTSAISRDSGIYSSQTTSSQNNESVHLKIDEKITLTCGKDGGVQNMEVHGILLLKVASEDDGKIKVHVQNTDTRNLQLQTHPNVDKKLFTKDSVIGLKDLSKSFPPGQDVGVLKWRYQTQEESEVPLTINCWPSETTSGCDVNIEYELQKTDLELNNVAIIIPIPMNVVAPIIKQCDGEYSYEKYKNHLIWRISSINDSNANGVLEFSVAGHPNDFFPVNVNFTSSKSYCNLQAAAVTNADNGSPSKFSTETVFAVEKYEIV